MKNYYEVLGVEKDAPLDQIKKAYRKLVRKYHPDMGETSDLERFLEIQKAFEVLSNQERRAEYDRDLSRSQQPDSSSGGPSRFGFFPGGKWESWFLEDLWFDRFASFPMSWWETVPGVLEIVLSPDEVKTNRFISVDIPVETLCAECRGSGFKGFFFCSTCRGEGTVRRLHPIKLPIPPGNRFNQILEVDLRELGLTGVLKVIFRLKPH